ncbi:hypothetical protein SCHPADRAFT_436815 [Schizopora paradoxa]|uniref:SAC3/GANP/THP3 conserved domain-containing protein n=1 Tax=Schizopora paradoxa TaxID=27342 RepID=A0A0H2S590_9AGAM|nr:hypothetical protein SCHPADRAFT_436815 [Schizopora paradoxa]
MNTSLTVPAQSPPQRRGGAPGSAFGRGAGSKNKTWVANARSRGNSPSPGPSAEGRWERGGHRGGGRGAGSRAGAPVPNGRPLSRLSQTDASPPANFEPSNGLGGTLTPAMNGANKTWEELVKAREEERARAIREGKMDDPLIPKRLDEAITIVGTCPDMCPEFERYRRERENNLDKLECIIGPDGKPTKKVDHARAVKIYERGQGDKIIPSDLRPAPVLKRTLDYLFYTLLSAHAFSDAQAFVRDRSRAVRNDFTIQQDTSPTAIESFERCTRFHILSLHMMYGVQGFDRALEIQQGMNSLLSLKEFYDDTRTQYQSPNELEMRIYHRLGLIRDQHERNDKPPPHIAADPAFQLVTLFRSQVQAASAPITKQSKLRVNDEAMQTFGSLAGILREKGGNGMIFLIACFLEHNFGRGTVPEAEMDSILGGLSLSDIIDGTSGGGEQLAYDGVAEAEVDDMQAELSTHDQSEAMDADDDLDAFIGEDQEIQEQSAQEIEEETNQQPLGGNSSTPSPLKRSATDWLNNNFGGPPSQSTSSLAEQAKTPAGQALLDATRPSGSVFGQLVRSPSTSSPAFTGSEERPLSAFGSGGTSSAFGITTVKNVFGGPMFGASSSKPPLFPSPSPVPIFSANKEPVIEQNVSSMPLSVPSPPRTTSANTLDNSIASSSKPPSMPPPQTRNSSSPSNFRPNPYANPFVPKALSSPSPSTSSHTQKAALTPIRTDSLAKSPLSFSTSTPTTSHEGGIHLPEISTPPSLIFPATPATSTPVSKGFDSIGKGQGTPLSINTTSSFLKGSSSGLFRKAVAIDSPVAPPPLGRHGPISLPSTPTGTTSNAPFVVPPTPTTFPPPRGGILGLSNMSSESIVVSTPPPKALSSNSLFETVPVAEIPEPEKIETDVSPMVAKKPRSEDLHAMALRFSQTSSIVRRCLTLWKKRTADQREWKEACDRSEVYKQRLHESTSSVASSSRFSSPALSKRRRESVDVSLAPLRTRRRRDVSGQNYTVPRTDEELAQRLRENKKENERRWARGSFVQAIKGRVNGTAQGYEQTPSNWRVWLSMNPDNDRTAIFLEQKFNVPESGDWESESIFSIPISEGEVTSESFPGLLIFECAPLDGIPDEIERKYRVLDECSRLREIIESLPLLRHFTPSILVIMWDHPGEYKDLLDMLEKQKRDAVILDHHVLAISTGQSDFDEVFNLALSKLHLDLKGELVERWSLQDVFESLTAHWRDAFSMWADACNAIRTFNWRLFTHVSTSFVDSIIVMEKIALNIWDSTRSFDFPFPTLHFENEEDSSHIIYTLRSWLRSSVLDRDYLLSNLASADFSENFDPRAFFNHVLNLTYLHLRRYAANPDAIRSIPKALIDDSTSQLSDHLQLSQARLREVARTLPRATFKRNSNGYGYSSEADDSSRRSSPSPSSPLVNGNSSKRMRLSEASDAVEPPSPTPSHTASVADSSASVVTISMLRSLAKDILKTYGTKS